MAGFAQETNLSQTAFAGRATLGTVHGRDQPEADDSPDTGIRSTSSPEPWENNAGAITSFTTSRAGSSR